MKNSVYVQVLCGCLGKHAGKPKALQNKALHRLPTIQNHFCVKEISRGQAGVAM